MSARDSLIPARDQEGKCGYCPHQEPCAPGKCDPRVRVLAFCPVHGEPWICQHVPGEDPWT